jgi:ParB/RepB/Spo0J family partition protein
MKLEFIAIGNIDDSAVNMRHGKNAPDVSDILPTVRRRGIIVPVILRPGLTEGRFELVAGRRRVHAARLAQAEDGADPELGRVPSAIMEAGDDAAALEASLIENIARLDPDEVTQWETFTRLVKEGREVDDIAVTFGLPDLTIRRVLALGNLLPRIRNLYRDEKIDRTTVRHLTLASKSQQRAWLALHDDPDAHAPSGHQLKAWLRPEVALRLMVAHAIVGSHLWTVRPEPRTTRNDEVRESIETARGEAVFDERRRAVLDLLGFSSEEPTVTGGNGDDYGVAGVFLRLTELPDPAVMEVIAVVIGEAMAAGSAAVEAVGTEIGIDMADWWQADDALFGLIRDREVLGRMVADVAGQLIATANAGEKSKTLKRIIGDHLAGADGRAKVERWVPRWMHFPPSAYTTRGGVGTVAAHAKAIAARDFAVTPHPDEQHEPFAQAA